LDKKVKSIRGFMQEVSEKTHGLFISFLILAVLLIISAIFIPKVFQLKNLENLLRTYAPGGIVAVGLSLVILTGEIDVSVGAIMTLAMAVAAKIYDFSEPAAIAAICATGIGTGFLNGLLITKTKVPSLMLTIGTTSVFNGLAAILVKAQKKYITDIYEITLSVAKGSILGIPIPLLVCLVLAILFQFILRKTSFGKHIYYTGTNKRAAWMSGVNIDRVKIICFMASGLLAAVAALLLSGQLGSSTVQLGTGYDVTAISIAVLGGISLKGGKGTVIGTLLGFITMSLMQNMLAIAQFGTYVSTTLKGVMIVLVVYLYGLTAKRKE